MKRSNGLNVKAVLSRAKFLLMLFFPQDGPVLKTGGIQKGRGWSLMNATTKGALQAGKPVGRFKISKEAGEWTATNFHLYLPSEMYLTCRGPQYVCTTFWTFVCTNCSGVHREFSHRVKSVSMAKFNTEEVNALQAGGNESVPAFPNSAKSRNPFDLNDDNNQAQGPMLPSMLHVQGALPNLSAPTALLQTADTHSSHLMQPQASSYGSIPPSQILSSGMSPSPGYQTFFNRRHPD
ncbi:unnamed protein product [Camellia sinensis]